MLISFVLLGRRSDRLFLLIDYIYLDIDERIKFIKNNHEYLIDVLIFDNDKIISNNTSKIKLSYSQPCKELIFRAQVDYLIQSNIVMLNNYMLDYFKNSNIIDNIQIIMNGVLRLSSRESNYFYLIQNYQYHSNNPPNGLFIYSFSLNPESIQPSGSCNLSKIDDLQLIIQVNKDINYLNQAKIRIYACCINILKIENGNCALIFSNN